MAVWLPVLCPDCGLDNIIKHGRLITWKQRYLCQNPDCLRRTLVLNVEQPGRKREILVNNAGVMLIGPIDGADTQDWQRMGKDAGCSQHPQSSQRQIDS